ncbi:MAG: Maf family protein [Nitrospira sp.]|nr:Maf family protein [Nitrospira sp.]MCP9442276.1 Maf family protein [Nitrospira sp.]
MASTSPRRRELLALLGVPFEVCEPSFVEQPMSGLAPREQVAYFALEKARSVAKARPGDMVLGGDTVIESEGCLLGKPRDREDARRMLMSLAGRSHQVHTAVALCHRARSIERVDVATATVHMKVDSGGGIERYLETGEFLGKAGSYSIQGRGADLIERIDGDYTTVVGLPLKVVASLLRAAGCPVAQGDVEAVYRQKPYPNWSRFVS